MCIGYKRTISREEIDQLPVFVYNGEAVVVDCTSDIKNAVDFLSKHNTIGFDTETKPAFKKGEFHHVSLLQLSVKERVYLFRLNKCGLSKDICCLLANPQIIKVGVGIKDDLKALRRLRDFRPASFIDLQAYVGDAGINEKSFSKLMAIVFGVKIFKRQRTSNWEASVLTEPQVRYAATDAWGALQIFEKLRQQGVINTWPEDKGA